MSGKGPENMLLLICLHKDKSRNYNIIQSISFRMETTIIVSQESINRISCATYNVLRLVHFKMSCNEPDNLLKDILNDANLLNLLKSGSSPSSILFEMLLCQKTRGKVVIKDSLVQIIKFTNKCITIFTINMIIIIVSIAKYPPHSFIQK